MNIAKQFSLIGDGLKGCVFLKEPVLFVRQSKFQSMFTKSNNQAYDDENQFTTYTTMTPKPKPYTFEYEIA